MPFKYVATTKDGKLMRGVAEESDRQAVAAELAARGWIVVKISPVGAFSFIGRDRLRRLVTGVRHVDKVLLTKHLSVMLRSGLTLLESLRILQEQSASWRMKLVLDDVAQAIERGGSFATALEAYPQAFDPFYVNIVRAGELSGNLEANLAYLAGQLTKEHELRSRVRSAMTYPIIVLSAALLIGFIFAIYVIPQVANLFIGLKGIKLPTLTVWMIGFAKLAKNHGALLLFGMVGGISFIVWLLKRRFLAPVTHFVTLRLPGIGSIAQNVNLARFALVFGTLLKSGVPITQAVTVVSQVVTNVYFRNALLKVHDELERGNSLAPSLGAYPKLFPTITSRMVAVGEKSGRLEDVLGYLSEFYQQEVESALKSLSSIIEPVLLLLIGLFALGLAFAIIIPIYNFVSFIGRI